MFTKNRWAICSARRSPRVITNALTPATVTETRPPEAPGGIGDNLRHPVHRQRDQTDIPAGPELDPLQISLTNLRKAPLAVAQHHQFTDTPTLWRVTRPLREVEQP